MGPSRAAAPSVMRTGYTDRCTVGCTRIVAAPATRRQLLRERLMEQRLAAPHHAPQSAAGGISNHAHQSAAAGIVATGIRLGAASAAGGRASDEHIMCGPCVSAASDRNAAAAVAATFLN